MSVILELDVEMAAELEGQGRLDRLLLRCDDVTVATGRVLELAELERACSSSQHDA